jgi:hypothetical protein
VNLLVRKTASGKRIFPLSDDARDRMLETKTAELLKGRIYVEVPPGVETEVPRKEAVYATKVMKPEVSAKMEKPKSNRKVT